MGFLSALLGFNDREREGWHKSPHPHKAVVFYEDAAGNQKVWEKEYTEDYVYFLMGDEYWRYAYSRAKEFADTTIKKGFWNHDEDNFFPAHMVQEVRVREIA